MVCNLVNCMAVAEAVEMAFLRWPPEIAKLTRAHWVYRRLTRFVACNLANARARPNKLTFCAVGFRVDACLRSALKDRSFRQDTVARLNKSPLPRSGSGKNDEVGRCR